MSQLLALAESGRYPKKDEHMEEINCICGVTDITNSQTFGRLELHQRPLVGELLATNDAKGKATYYQILAVIHTLEKGYLELLVSPLGLQPEYHASLRDKTD